MILIFLFLIPPLALPKEEKEIPGFGLLLNGGESASSGFINSFNAAPAGGLAMSYGFNNRWDGLWSLDYYTMPNQPLTLSLPSPSNPVSQSYIQPTDDVAISVNARYYWNDKWDDIHKKFNVDPYLTAGLGLDLVVDLYPPDPNSFFWSKPFDILLGVNLGAGIDVPLTNDFIIYGEGLDHFIFWQGLTQDYVGKVGIKFMLDTEHADPFRGTLQ